MLDKGGSTGVGDDGGHTDDHPRAAESRPRIGCPGLTEDQRIPLQAKSPTKTTVYRLFLPLVHS